MSATTARPAQPLTAIQYTIARRLARRFDHLWGNAPEIVSADRWTTAAIREETAAAFPGEKIGIFAPEIDASSNVYHTTTGQRLTWIIRPAGQTAITIRRRDGDLFFVTLRPADGPALWRIDVYAHDYHAGIGQRHVSAAARAVGAIVAPELCRHDQHQIGRDMIKGAGIVAHGKAYHAEVIENAFREIQSATNGTLSISAEEIERMTPYYPDAEEIARIISDLCHMARQWQTTRGAKRDALGDEYRRLFDA